MGRKEYMYSYSNWKEIRLHQNDITEKFKRNYSTKLQSHYAQLTSFYNKHHNQTATAASPSTPCGLI